MAYKRASVEVQFNWVFVLVAGALILLFFSTIVIKQKSTAETSRHITILNSLSSIITGTESTAGATNQLNLPETTIEFSCNAISIGEQSRQFENLVLFAPSEAESPPLVLHTRKWSIPYRASNIVYLTSPRVRYVLIGPPEETEKLEEMIPSPLTVESYPAMPEELPRIEDTAVRFVFFADISDPGNAPPEQLRRRERSDITALRVEDPDQVSFFRMNAAGGWQHLHPGQPLYYSDDETLLGAAIIDDPSNYDCVTSNMLRKSSTVSTILADRAGELGSSLSRFTCSPAYGQAQTIMEDLSALQRLDQTTVEELEDARVELEEKNRQLQLQSCALLY